MDSTIRIITAGPMLLKARMRLSLATLGRLALVTIALIPLVILGLTAWFWLESHVPDRVYWKGALAFLVIFEIAYVSAVISAAIGTLVVGWLVLRARRTRRNAHWLSRGLLSCVGILIGVIVAEATAAAWQFRAHRYSALPAGGLRRQQASGDDPRFPAPAADFPLRTNFPDPPGDNPIDLVVLGESSAEGVPFSTWLSIGSILQWKLSLAFPGRPIRGRVLARSGDTLEWQHRELANLPRRPDILIIFCGHNEFSSRLAASRELDHYFDEQLPTAWDILVGRTERLSPLCGLIHETEEKCKIAHASFRRSSPTGGHSDLHDDGIHQTSGGFSAPAGADRGLCRGGWGDARPRSAGGQRRAASSRTAHTCPPGRRARSVQRSSVISWLPSEWRHPIPSKLSRDTSAPGAAARLRRDVRSGSPGCSSGAGHGTKRIVIMPKPATMTAIRSAARRSFRMPIATSRRATTAS